MHQAYESFDLRLFSNKFVSIRVRLLARGSSISAKQQKSIICRRHEKPTDLIWVFCAFSPSIHIHMLNCVCVCAEFMIQLYNIKITRITFKRWKLIVKWAYEMVSPYYPNTMSAYIIQLKTAGVEKSGNFIFSMEYCYFNRVAAGSI